MSIATPMLFENANVNQYAAECRVYQRHACELPTSCQPASVQEMRETRWPATICDISQSGVGLILKRRYEKGAALAVELPGHKDHPPSIVFVRVIHVKRDEEGMWKLGCKFISELSEDDIRRLLNADLEECAEPQQLEQETPTHDAKEAVAVARPDKTTYTDVRLEIEDRSGACFKMTIKQLGVKNNHLVAQGQQLRIIGGQSQGKNWAFQIEVDHLEQVGGQWRLRGFLVQPTLVSEVKQFLKAGNKPV